MISASLSMDRAVLLALQLPETNAAEVADSMLELRELTRTLGCAVVGEMVQQRPRPHPGTLFGAGKLEEIKTLASSQNAGLVIVDQPLSPAQGQNLERILEVMVLDRTQVILEIFSQHARTRESNLQVQLAHLEYMLPRLVGLWAHLDRERGGIGGSKGTGEKQVDLDRTMVRTRIAKLKKDLRTLGRERGTQKKRRANTFRVSLVGYTNAGKSTLMNRLTDANIQAEDKLFATLDPTTRILFRKNRPHIVLSDTVGFIRHLPHQLVASFRSTLEVVREADLLLHVVDVSHENHEHHIETTHQVLEDIGARNIPWLMVFNKTDKMESELALKLAKKRYPDGLFVSATEDSCQDVKQRVVRFFEKSMVTTPLFLDYSSYGELSKIYRWSRVDEVRYEPEGIHLTVTSTPANLDRIRASVSLGEAPQPIEIH